MIIRRNIKSNYQRVNNNGIDAVRCLMSLISVEGLLQQYNPVRFLKIAYYNRIINRHFGEMLQHCIDSSIDSSNSKHSVFSTARTFHSDKCKAQFIQGAVPQIRMLLIAGNETTSSTLIYAYHLLHKNPSARTRLIEEHNRVFGNLSNTSKALSSTSAFKLLNQIHYTHAVIKETLRISLPTGAVRDGCPNTSLIDANGLHYPTEGCMVSLAHLAIHTNPRSYSEAGNFKPERWLEDHEDVERGAFRPFERGARDCLGQNLAVLQLKIALLMTVRRFAIVPAYEEWDEIQKKNISFDSFVRGRLLGRNVDAKKEVDGERAYHVEKDGGAHPKAGYPCRVQLLADEKSCSAHLAVSGQE
jgi:hypothetical protein